MLVAHRSINLWVSGGCTDCCLRSEQCTLYPKCPHAHFLHQCLIASLLIGEEAQKKVEKCKKKIKRWIVSWETSLVTKVSASCLHLPAYFCSMLPPALFFFFPLQSCPWIDTWEQIPSSLVMTYQKGREEGDINKCSPSHPPRQSVRWAIMPPSPHFNAFSTQWKMKPHVCVCVCVYVASWSADGFCAHMYALCIVFNGTICIGWWMLVCSVCRVIVFCFFCFPHSYVASTVCFLQWVTFL